ILSRRLQSFFQRWVTIDGLRWSFVFKIKRELPILWRANSRSRQRAWRFGFVVNDAVRFEVDDLDLRVCDQKLVDDAVKNSESATQTKAELAPQTFCARRTRRVIL